VRAAKRVYVQHGVSAAISEVEGALAFFHPSDPQDPCYKRSMRHSWHFANPSLPHGVLEKNMLEFDVFCVGDGRCKDIGWWIEAVRVGCGDVDGSRRREVT
jgi:hypothetical protein